MATLEERRPTAAAGVKEAVWEDGFAWPRVFRQPTRGAIGSRPCRILGGDIHRCLESCGLVGHTEIGACAHTVRGDVRWARTVRRGDVGLPPTTG